MTQAKLVAVIGAGASGLTTIKSLKEEGFYVVCYEKTDNLGGLWKYREEEIEGVGSVMNCTVSNISKELMAFSDFPPPNSFPNFMSHKYVLKYLDKYAEAFDLLRHIKYRHEVIRVLPTADNYRTGRWEVTIKDYAKNRLLVEVFDGVAVCVGRYGFPRIPNFNSLETFKGKILHTHNIKNAEPFKDQRVLVVGAGNSGADAAVYLSTVAEQVYLSSRQGTWVVQRPGSKGLPADLSFNRRIVSTAFQKLPRKLVFWFLEKQVNKRFNHNTYHLKPPHRFLTKRPTINDHLASKILSGDIILKGAIKYFTEKGVVFRGDNEIVNVDIVIMATGYQLKVPFLNDIIFQVIGDHVPLYKHVFPPHLSVPSMAIIGMTQVFGGVFPVCEMQARWFAAVLNNKVSFPDKGDIINDITLNTENETKLLHSSARNCMQVYGIPYMDELAEIIGVKPNFRKLLLRDPRLTWTCVMGPCLPYQYRLEGPHSWVGARAAILTYKERVFAPLRTRYETR
ncbi:flavin-containing monooxygenase 5-like [Stegodyphus dumicola]|uniref:flavin-containing monooxygenase 5-like n=1 Tax=Stegodyphus dumicola TaxID=202533 RepID=UPI0015AA8895|nr:flavin-containing monooxygenase 5-like [Stegodyphus dumicola]XP_035217730.1 flavin-containing monooxygenase 5-like [Stegodyphus dumicola]XP_035217731.1 flavin-containing monooxygenase 5-like [Stegodyphus dumicola]XP_035217734.1 flavin-containing monooxygenase 5-like [Stegodyphus dumicola]XP_035217735.1 flavin-containing monooxygenase 5-like [Stegodyphus dumicola]XP_035217736.1 flavin-containing monooxygenase 5-like [Stegodyphus dumicola]